MEKDEIELMVAENQIAIDFDALSMQEEESTILPQSVIKPVNYEWIKEEVLFIVVKAYNNAVAKDLPNLRLCGKKLLDWVLNAGSHCEHKIIEDCQDIIERVRAVNTDKKIIAVFYSDTPLLDRASFNGYCEYFSAHNMNFLQLKRGFIVKTEYLKSNYAIAQGVITKEDKHLMQVDSAKTLNYMSNIMYNKILNYHIKNGVIIYGESSVFIDADVEIEGGVIIYPNNIIKGQSIIAEGAVLESGNIIKDSIISNNAVIKNSYIENSKIGTGVTIEPLSKIIGQEI